MSFFKNCHLSNMPLCYILYLYLEIKWGNEFQNDYCKIKCVMLAVCSYGGKTATSKVPDSVTGFLPNWPYLNKHK